MLLTPIVLSVVCAGIAFDFINGFHDAANSIATVVATRVLTPVQAVMWAAFFNMMAYFLFGSGVAATVGNGLIVADTVTPAVILCGLLGAALWNIATWRARLPSSSSHALLGGYAGAAAMFGWAQTHAWAHVAAMFVATGWLRVLVFMVAAPLIGLAVGSLASHLTRRLKDGDPAVSDRRYRRAQLASSAFLSLTHGSNDAQKTAGVIAGALFAAHAIPVFAVPQWVLALSYAAMAFGTLFGGWRIVRTVGGRLTRLTPRNGFCAETGAAIAILGATLLELPVSTTHVTTGAIIGVGSADPERQVHWQVARRIAYGWLLTIPAAAAIGALTMLAGLKIFP